VLCQQVNDFVHLSDRAYTHEQILVMEKIILGKLEWTLTVPTPYVFLARFIKASIPDLEVSKLMFFFSSEFCVEAWKGCFDSLYIAKNVFMVSICVAGKHGVFSC
jgi:hypothetical protein